MQFAKTIQVATRHSLEAKESQTQWQPGFNTLLLTNLRK
jgi:hypothetical protein